jgi:DNA polymerase I-like protein with 3'-5' exonuclease and polymerase domains
MDIILLGSSLSRELKIMRSYADEFEVDTRVMFVTSGTQIPHYGNLAIIGQDSRYPAARFTREKGSKTQGGKKVVVDREIIKVPILGKAQGDDYVKGGTATRRACYMACKHYSGGGLKPEIPFSVVSPGGMWTQINDTRNDGVRWIDFETTGLDATRDRVVSVAVNYNGRTLVTTRGHAKIPWLLQQIAESRIPLGGCNNVFEQGFFYHKTGRTANMVEDVQVDHALLDEENYHGLDMICGLADMWGYDHEMEQYLASSKAARHATAPINLFNYYAAGDVYVLPRIKAATGVGLYDESGTPEEVRSWLVRGQDSLARLQIRGIKLDDDMVRNTWRTMETRISEATEQIQTLAAEHGMQDFNIRSAPQKQKLLYEKLGLPVLDTTATGAPSCSDDALQKLRGRANNPIVDAMCDLGTTSALLTGTMARCMEAVNHDGFVRSNLSLTKLVTGQISSTNPPLQNVPKSDFRRMFISRFPGGHIMETDYSQLHLRIIGNLAQCKGFIDAYLNGVDLHARTIAGVITDHDEEHVLRALAEGDLAMKDHRSAAKRTNFSIIFEIGAKALSANIGRSVEECKGIISRFFLKYPEIEEQISRQHAFARKNGYVVSPMGRVRHLPNIDSHNRWAQLRAMRQAGDFLISNSGRYITMYSMIELDEMLMERNLQSCVVMQVHDSIETDVHPDEVDEVIECTQECMVHKMMEYCADWMDPIPLEVDGFIGPNWYEEDKEWEISG